MATEPGNWHVSPWVSIPRLEGLLQCRLSEITWATLARLVTEGTPEDLSIDFKGAMYDPGEKGGFELAKDVAAFSNASGGLIVVGIGDSGGRASGFSRQTFSDIDIRHVRTVLINRLAPYVEDLEVGVIASEADGYDCLLILIPPSMQAPHAVTSSKDGGSNPPFGLSWPVREGSQTRWLREAELSLRYRERFTEKFDAAGRGILVLKDGIAALDRTDSAWLAVSLIPSTPARNRSLSVSIRDEIVSSTSVSGYPGYPFSSFPSFARGRVVLSDRFEHYLLSQDHHHEFYVDGSAFTSLRIGSDVPNEVHDGRMRLPRGPVQAVLSEDVAIWLLQLLSIGARHAIAFGSSGQFHVTAQLVIPLAPDESPLDAPVPSHAERAPEPLVLTQLNRFSGPAIVSGSFPVSATMPVSSVVPASIALEPRELTAASSRLAHEIYAEFGQFPSLSIIDQSGSVVSDAPTHSRYAAFRSWAESNGLLE